MAQENKPVFAPPSQLHEVLPVGTRAVSGNQPISELRLERRGNHMPAYWGRWDNGEDRDFFCTPREIDWSSVPAELVGAKPTEERATFSEERWLERLLRRLPGLTRVDVSREPLSENFIAGWSNANGGQFRMLVNGDDVFLEDERAIEQKLRDCGLLKTPSDVGPEMTMLNGAPHYSDRQLRELGARFAEREAHVYGIPLQVEKPTCAECRALCAVNSVGLCGYCAIATNGGRQSRELTDRVAAGATAYDPKSYPAGQRLALMDAREKPRPSRWSRELERKHPWESDDV